jgi:pilus assembly protein Flp/PilA
MPKFKILKGEHKMFNLLKTYLRSLPKTKKGQAMVEYGLIIGLIAVVCIAALVILGPKIAGMFTSISNKLVTS